MGTAAAESVFPLGRLEPTDWVHVERYPLSIALPAAVEHVERLLKLPGWRRSHDQGREGSCVGHAVAMERAITNRAQALRGGVRVTVRYDPLHVWNEAKKIDEWPSTNPGDNNGTSVRAAYEVARTIGLSRVRMMQTTGGVPHPIGAKSPTPADGIEAYRWATTVDEVRTAIAEGLPVAIGVSWYRAFDTPTKRSGEWWLPASTKPGPLGGVRGGHSVCLAGASDRREAFRLVNSWGPAYPLAWLPYSTLQLLLTAGGEAAVVTDR